MTALGSGMPDRESTTDDAPRRGIGRQIAAIMAIGLIFRLILAYGIDGLRGSGFGADLGLFNYWADTLAQHGPWGFYANASYADYTPGYLYALWPIGALREVARRRRRGQDITDSLIKLPAIITDVLLGYLVASMALELGVTRRRALIAAAVVILNPITWFDSVIWGQVDSFGTLFLLLGVRELWRGRSERAAVLAVVAALIKPQLAILVPIVAVVTIRRALWPKGGYGDEAEPRRRGFACELRDIGWLRILTTGAAGFLTAVALSAPFGLTVIGVSSTAPFLESSLLRLVFSTAATYPYLSVNAYNWWALFPVDGQSVATAGGALWMPDSPVPDAAAWGAIGPIPAALVGAALLLGTAAIVAWVVARHPDRLTILVGVSVLALAFFAAPTRVHERYLFPFFGLAAILFAFSTRWRIAYVVAGIATFLNMYVVLVALYPDNPGVSDWLGIGEAIRSPFGVTVVALLHSAAFVWGVLQLRPGARRALAAQLERGRVEEECRTAPEPETRQLLATEPARRRRRCRRWSRAPRPGSSRPLARPPPPAASGRPVDAAPAAAAAPRARLVRPAVLDRDGTDRVAARPRGRDAVPAGPVGEPRPRAAGAPRPAGPVPPDRVRGRGAGPAHVPARRPGPDALRRGLPRPHRHRVPPVLALRHLARHLRVDPPAPRQVRDGRRDRRLRGPRRRRPRATSACPVRDAAVEPRREDPPGAGDRAGDRIWVATGSELVAYDLATRGRRGALGPAGRERGRLRRDRAPGSWSGRTRATCYAVDATALDADRRRPTRRTPRSRRSR